MTASSLFGRACLVSAIALLLAAPAVAQDFKAEFDAQWGLGMIGVQDAWDIGMDGSGVLVGVTDSGFEIGGSMHVDFTNSFSGLYMDGYKTGLTDTNGHGTHVAGIIAADRNGIGMVGVAPGSKIVPLRMLNGPDGTGIAPDDITASVLNYAMDNGVRLFNASWGYPGGYRDYPIPEGDQLDDSSLAKAYLRLVSSDSVIVFATGNDSGDRPSLDSALPFYYPELGPAWLAVTSVGPTGKRAWYAQACDVAMYWCLAAPGGDQTLADTDGIYSTYPTNNYAYLQGTSMATPHVTGALAIARQLYPKARMQDLSQLVMQTARDIGDPGVDKIFGWGMLNVSNLVATRSAAAGTIHAQASWAQSATIDTIIDQIAARRASSANDGGVPIWITPYGAFGGLTSTIADKSGQYGAAGLLAGADLYHDSQWRVGLTVGTSGQSFSSDTGNSAGDFGIHAGAYAAFDNGQVFGDLTVGGSYFSGTTMRNAAPGLAGTVLGGAGLGNSGQHTDVALWGGGKLGAHMDVGNIGMSPYGFARVMQQRLGGVVETGGNALVLDVAARDATRVEIGFGFELLAQDIVLERYSLTPSLDLAYGRIVGDDHSRDFALLGSTMTANTDTLGPDVLHVGVGMTLTSTDGMMSAKFGYQGDFRAGAFTHAASLKVSAKF